MRSLGCIFFKKKLIGVHIFHMYWYGSNETPGYFLPLDLEILNHWSVAQRCFGSARHTGLLETATSGMRLFIGCCLPLLGTRDCWRPQWCCSRDLVVLEQLCPRGNYAGSWHRRSSDAVHVLIKKTTEAPSTTSPHRNEQLATSMEAGVAKN